MSFSMFFLYLLNYFDNMYSHFFNFAINSDLQDTEKFKIAKFSSLGTPSTPGNLKKPPHLPQKKRQVWVHEEKKSRILLRMIFLGPKEPIRTQKRPTIGTQGTQRTQTTKGNKAIDSSGSNYFRSGFTCLLIDL